MHTRAIKHRGGPLVLVRPLRRGDSTTVLALFERLGEASRRTRFNGPKPSLSDAELAELTQVDEDHHALVAYVAGDPQPAAIARLVRTSPDRAEIAFAVADEYQHRGVGTALAAELLVDARAAGIAEVTALACSDNPAALRLLRRTARVTDVHYEGPELSIRAAIA
jgi:ribosomal protein S18 acetylase RimI-like enzyme